NIMILTVSSLIAIAVLIYNPAKTFGVPAALIFILAGLFMGNGGNYPAFNYPEETEFLSQFALSIIIFTGGFQTPFSRIKSVVGEGLVLANFGVLVTAILVGVFASFITPLSLLEGMLLGAIISSTDAAATYSILETRKLKLKYNTGRALEMESATNDPMAMILTLVFCMMLGNSETGGFFKYAIYFGQQLLVGGLSALMMGLILKQIFKRMSFREENLKPIFLLAILLVTTLGADILGGNILVAAFILGLMLGNTDFKYKKTSRSFFSTLSWLAQATMFVILGLQIFPNALMEAFGYAWLPALFLFFMARPVAVLVSYLPFRQPFNKQLFVSWIGIKGATPIVFALMPLILGIPRAELIFNITVVVVIFSMILHGFTLELVAKKLGLLN
ncbi:MAG: potassium/proton antiporter, partial [Bacteroidales bacterium]|nr:potassium/proton antiporter [Bacteroidales bacterium]